MRARPERVVLGVKEGVTPSSKPAVRIFLGTEPAQHRAERIFVWSIEQARDPSRVYEIHLMKELAGFDRRRWLTGFTNYRYAIPHFAGGKGRAIWNDVDEIYLADPGELFDTDMNDHAFLTVPKLAPGARTDSSVMLMDCERMLRVWPLEATQSESSKSLLDRALAIPGLHGHLDPAWNARDEEYVEGRSKLIHYTVLHTQPWQPLPRYFVYQRNPVGEVWFDLERSADAAGFYVFSSERPSRQYEALFERLRAARGRGARPQASESPGERTEDVRDLVARTQAQSVLDYGLGKGEKDGGAPEELAARYGVGSATRYDPAFPPLAERPSQRFDGVVCSEVLEYLPDEDVPWAIGELFACARHFVYATVADCDLAKPLGDGTQLHSRARGRNWWYAYFEAASARHPDVHWGLALHTRSGRKPWVTRLRDAGRRLGGAPAVWVLTDGKPENTAQSVALAEALGWPYEKRGLHVTKPCSAWPDVVIAAGRRPSRAARWIGRQSRGRTRVVQLGRDGGQSAEPFDMVVTCGHPDLPPDRRRIETLAPLNPVTPERAAQAAQHLPSPLGEAPHPRVLLLVGTTAHHPLDGQTAQRMAEEVRSFAQDAGGSVLAVASHKTGSEATEALGVGLGAAGHLQQWEPEQAEDPDLACLAWADVIVVSGESELPLAEAAATGKPVYIYPIPRRRLGLRLRLGRWVEARAHGRPLNRRGTVRPQQGLEYLCARLIERGFVRPPRDLNELHQTLIRRGVAAPFGEPLPTGARPALREAEEVARRIRLLLGCSETPEPRAAAAS